MSSPEPEVPNHPANTPIADPLPATDTPPVVDSPTNWFDKGVAHEAAGEVPEALDAFAKETEANPGNALAWLSLGGLLTATGEFEKALPALRKALDADPALAGDEDEVGFLAYALNETGDPSGALAVIDEAAKSNPKILESSSIRYQAGNAQIAVGNAAKALEELKSAEALTDEPWLLDLILTNLGVAHQMSGDLVNGLDAFDRALALPLEGERTLLWAYKAVAYVGLKDKDQAAAAVNNTLKTQNPQPAVLLLRAPTFTVLGRYQEALADFERLPSEVAESSFVQNAWAGTLILVGKNKEGFEKLEVLAQDPKNENFEAWLICGSVRSSLARYRPSLKALSHARSLDPKAESNPVYLTSLISSLSGTGQHQGALNTADALLELDPKDALYHFYRGIALAGLGQGNEAVKEFDATITLAPTSAIPVIAESAALTQKGHVLLGSKLHDQALAAFARAAELAEQVGNLPNQISALVGKALTLQSRSESARERHESSEASQKESLRAASEAVDLGQLLPRGPVPALAWWAKGNILSWQDRHEEALIAYRQASEMQPDFVRIRLSLGEGYERLQDHLLAVAAFAEAAKIADTPAERSDAWFGKGRNSRFLERFEDAIESCRSAIEANGENEKILELLGRAYSTLDRNEAALQTYRRGWALGLPNHRSADCALGVSAVLLAQGRNAESQTFLEKAAKETTFKGELHYNYGVTLCRLKNYKLAAKAFRQAATMGVAGADEQADKLEGGDAASRTWLEYWFGPTLWIRKALGVVLSLLLVIAVLPSVLKPDALTFLPWLDLTKDWKVVLIPIVLLSTLLLLPILKRVSVGKMELDISQPEPQVGRPDMDSTLKVFLEANPTPLVPGTHGPG